MSDVLIKAEGVSKKFCKNLKQSMLYGVGDIAKTMLGISPKTDELKPGEFWAIDDVSFELKRGECLGLIGANGSGKSTLLKIFNGIISPDKGRVEIKGRVGALIEIGAGFHPLLTGRENIYVNGSILGFSKKEIDNKFDEIVEFAELADFIDTPVKYYSSGMYVRLGFAIAAQMEPDVMLIDEVLAVGDVGFRAKCFNAINNMLKNSTVVFVSHSMPQISRLCSDIIVMNFGKSEFQGKDVPKGINIFYSHFQSQEEIVSGSGKATIHNIELECRGKKEIQTINYLDNLIIHLYTTIDRKFEYPTFTITFYNQELYQIAQWCSLFQNAMIQNTGLPLHITVNFNEINLNPSDYFITVGILDGDNREVLTRHFATKKIQVRGDFVGHAPVQLLADWSITE